MTTGVKKLSVKHDNIAESEFEDLNLSGSRFTNINLSRARFHDINLSEVTFTAVQIGGALFKHNGIGVADMMEAYRKLKIQILRRRKS